MKTHTAAVEDWAASKLDGYERALDTWYIHPNQIRSVLSAARAAGLVVEPVSLCEICKTSANGYAGNSSFCAIHHPDYEHDPYENPSSDEDLIRLYFRDD